MRRLLLVGSCCTILGCKGEETGPDVAVSLEFASLPAPSVVLGDTLRDTSGIVAPLRAKAFNSGNEQLAAAAITYTVIDRGAQVDSLTGIVIGDSIRATPVRLVASLGGLQSPPLPLYVVPRPDSASASGSIDTLRYSVTDTTKNVSGSLSVRVLHKSGTTTQPVRSYPVSFRIIYPIDTLAALLLSDDNRRSSLDTTGADGTASLKVRIRPERLTIARDSVIVLATVRHRGAHLNGSPVRLVLPFRPLVQ